jgi:hypothetical protein
VRSTADAGPVVARSGFIKGGAGNRWGDASSVFVVRRHLPILLVLAVVVVLAGVAAAVVWQDLQPTGPACTFTANGQRYGLDRAQVANAMTIAPSATSLGLPHHAVTVALAAAFQESGLNDLAHGDRDSVGLFQQRPSQGWATPAQLVDTRYSSDAFLRALSHVAGWESIPVAEAAQRVQRSAKPNAYARWEAEARALARAVTGEVVGSLSCRSG